ncbi:inclusion membrane protein GarD [Candidatus Chlamydia corallus]|uniref:inclusion membrane protein GarD n=1 Tax=Candidatus Chlamydia corallus TaxID=2038470 RepID=UPI000C2FA14F|nr:hypothetical protein [Candidatus Chlamydia corallus]
MAFFPPPGFVIQANAVTRNRIFYLIEQKYVAPPGGSRIVYECLSNERVPGLEFLFSRPGDFTLTGFKAVENLSNLFDSFALLILCFSRYNRGQTQGSEGTALVILGATLLFFVIALILGPTLGAVVYCAYKIHEVVSMMRSLDRTKEEVLRNPPQNVFHRAAGIAAVRSSEETKKALGLYKTSMIVFLVVSLIASLGLIALTAGIVLALFFVVPGAAPVITAAMIGCCAAGGSALLVSLLGLWIAMVCKARKQEECVGHLTNAILHSSLSEVVISEPRSCWHANERAKNLLVTDCLSHYEHLFSQSEVAELIGEGDTSHRPDSQQPPPYSEVAQDCGPPPPYNPWHSSPSAPQNYP